MTSPADVAAAIAERAVWTYSRSSGPGGQRRDHAETRAQLTVTPAALEGLPGELAERLAGRLALDRRPLRLSSQAQRSLRYSPHCHWPRTIPSAQSSPSTVTGRAIMWACRSL